MYKFAVIFLIGMAGIWKAVPAGFLLKAPPLLVFCMTAFGAITSVTIICFLGNRIKTWITRKKGNRLQNKVKKGGELLQKFGVAGLGILGTVVLGANFTIIVGLILLDEYKWLLIWVIVGVFFLSGALTASIFLGLTIFSGFLPIQFLQKAPA